MTKSVFIDDMANSQGGKWAAYAAGDALAAALWYLPVTSGLTDTPPGESVRGLATVKPGSAYQATHDALVQVLTGLFNESPPRTSPFYPDIASLVQEALYYIVNHPSDPEVTRNAVGLILVAAERAPQPFPIA